MHAVSEGFALFDANGRLVTCNEAYRRIQGKLAGPPLRPGMMFEELVRSQVESRNFLIPDGEEESWVRRRLTSFRTGNRTFEIQRADGGWHQARDHHCPDGSVLVVCTDITDFKNRQHDLEQGERRLRDYLESAGDWYWETDQQHLFTSISPHFTEATGVPVERLLGTSRPESAPDGTTPLAWAEHMVELDAKQPFRDLIYAGKDALAGRRYYRVSGVPFYDADGEFAGYRGTALDCTADMEARHLRERHLEAIESFSGGYALYDKDDHLLEWNSAWIDFAHPAARDTIRRGAAFEDTVRANVAHGLFPEAQADPETWIAQRIRRHQECGTPWEIRGSRKRWFLMRERRTPDGGVLITSTDVTELKERENALRDGEERFRDFAETAADWFFELDTDLRLRFISPRYEKLTGIDPEELVGLPFEDIIARNEQAVQKTRCTLDQMRDGCELDGAEVEGHTSTGVQIIHSISAIPITDAAGHFAGYRGSGRDVTQARHLASQLVYQASHDELTGLVNRRELEDRLTRAIDRARDTDAMHALCFLDLDQFKVVNDTCGHGAGDELLRQLAQSLQTRLRARDTLARLGGDEFALLLEHCSLEQAKSVANTLRRTVEEHEFIREGKRFRLGVSIGLVPITGNLYDSSDALRAADTACYLAKEQGRNRVHVYSPDNAEVTRREGEIGWVSRINSALVEDRLTLFAQPIVPACPTMVQDFPGRFELLLRLTEDDGSLVPPGAFLPAAERYGLASHIDRWVVKNALTFINTHRAVIPAGTVFCINLSGHSMGDPDFTADLCSTLENRGPASGSLCFEVTESAAIAKLDTAREFMQTIRALGCQFALDDFGTGLSSFAYLRDLPVDYLKIDGSFIRDLDSDPMNLSMVRSINDIGHVLGKQTIVEHVAEKEDAQLLLEIGVNFLQGFGIGKPVPLSTLFATTGGHTLQEART
jgi:diguanylate cyclase (GGDEF)-like protein/PAS domain S-box-containing protein